MSLANIQAQLKTALDGITNIDTDHVFIGLPNTAPTQEQMPCIVVTLNRVTPTMPYQRITKCVYHFEIRYLYAPTENAQAQTASAAVTGYLKSVWDALFGVLTLSGNANTQDFDGDATGFDSPIQFNGLWFWGILVPWRVEDRTETTVTP